MQAPLSDVASLIGGSLPAGDAPLHSQIESALRELIVSGKLSAGSILPSEPGLAAELRVSRHTLRHALAALVDQGLLRRARGHGTEVLRPPVRSRIERTLNSFYAFAWEARTWGLEHRSRVLEFATVTATRALTDRLQLGSDRRVKRLIRVRSAADEPLIIETAYFPLHLMDGLSRAELAVGSVYDALERLHGCRVTRADERIAPILLTRHAAALLDNPVGSPAFLVERTTWAGSVPVEWQESIVRGDRVLYSVSLPVGSTIPVQDGT